MLKGNSLKICVGASSQISTTLVFQLWKKFTVYFTHIYLNWISTLLNQMQICKWGAFESWYFCHQINIIGIVCKICIILKKNCLSTNMNVKFVGRKTTKVISVLTEYIFRIFRFLFPGHLSYKERIWENINK